MVTTMVWYIAVRKRGGNNMSEEHKLPTVGERILVWNKYEDDVTERIFLLNLDGASIPIITVAEGHEDFYEKGEPFAFSNWRYWKPLPKDYSHLLKEAEEQGFVVGAYIKNDLGGIYTIEELEVYDDDEDWVTSSVESKWMEKKKPFVYARYGSGYARPISELKLVPKKRFKTVDELPLACWMDTGLIIRPVYFWANSLSVNGMDDYLTLEQIKKRRYRLLDADRNEVELEVVV